LGADGQFSPYAESSMTTSIAHPARPREPASDPAAVEPPRLAAAAAGWVLLGLLCTLVLMVTGSRLADRRFHWWFRVVIDPAWTERVLFYLGMAGLVVAWVGLARFARADRFRPWWMSAAAFLWCVPLLVGPPLFSHDIYSYLAQGTIAHIGLSPYKDAPAVLGGLGYHHVLQAVDPFWRGATAPYGPLFLGVISLIVGLTGSHVFAGVILIRLFDLLGLGLLAVLVPRIAGHLGADPVRAAWLAVASPVMLLQLVSPGHNDLLMAGVMVAGICLALEGRPLLGIVVCMVATTIKLPAFAAAVFIAVAWIRTAPSLRAGIERAVSAVIAAVATAAAVTLITGFGLGWISTSLFSTPGRVRLAITPATDLSFTIAKLLSGVSFTDVEPVLRALLVAATAIVGLVMVIRTRRHTLVKYLAVALVAAAIGGPALWPWYLAWGLPLLAAWRTSQRSWVLVAAIVVASFLVKPDGILLLSRGSSPVIAGLWVVTAGLAVLAWWRRARDQRPQVSTSPATDP